ncbi:hypothetical protein Tsubulata_024164 [Turnera subulata]|uniref:Prolamin-like domain-containing protein n=1 Tax=Turnera subulata TaxID=218843 RepID=A0A9Q0GM24_9ROSI|nr:hypothetical protein Tsubulata_024164 [Turnera subulata]
MVTPLPATSKTSKSEELSEKVWKAITECSSKISVHNGNLLKESLHGKGNPTDKVCLALVGFGKTCHEAFTKLMISKSPASEESKIWARSKSVWKHCSHDVSDNKPDISDSLTQTLLECGPKIEVKYGVQIRDNMLGKVKLDKEACVILIRWGKRCHLAFTEFLISKERDQDPSTVRERSKATWERCDQHKDDKKAPADDLDHPPSVVQAITRILLALNPDHHSGKASEEKEVTQANTQHRVRLEPLPVRRLVEVINP